MTREIIFIIHCSTNNSISFPLLSLGTNLKISLTLPSLSLEIYQGLSCFIENVCQNTMERKKWVWNFLRREWFSIFSSSFTSFGLHLILLRCLLWLLTLSHTSRKISEAYLNGIAVFLPNFCLWNFHAWTQTGHINFRLGCAFYRDKES